MFSQCREAWGRDYKRCMLCIHLLHPNFTFNKFSRSKTLLKLGSTHLIHVHGTGMGICVVVRCGSYKTSVRDVFHSLSSRRLITALHQAHKADVIDNLHSIVSATPPPQPNTQYTSENEKLVWYSTYLKERHLQLHITVELQVSFLSLIHI